MYDSTFSIKFWS